MRFKLRYPHSGATAGEDNCDFFREGLVDIHIFLVEGVGDGERAALVVEPTPRSYAKHPNSIWSKLRPSSSTDPVRISGFTLFDPSHSGHVGTYRVSIWEIHPITKTEIFKNRHWVEYQRSVSTRGK